MKKLCTILLLCFIASTVFGATITVDNPLDNGQGITLRVAVTNAQSGDEIHFDPALNGQNILINSPIIFNVADLKIYGNGQNNTIITEGNSTLMGVAGAKLTIENLTIRDFNNSTFSGGALLVYNELDLKNVSFINNHTTYHGGAIACTSNSKLKVTNGQFIGNSSDLSGGALFVEGTSNTTIEYTLVNTFFHSNDATLGGAVYADHAISEMVNCQVLNNTAQEGAGFYITESQGGKIFNTAVLTNTAVQRGGGIFAVGFPGVNIPLPIINSTIAGNTAASGGGIFGFSQLQNSIIAQNTATSYTDLIASQTTLAGGNLIGEASTPFANISGSNLIGSSNQPIDPLFINLAAHYGRLCALSPAINIGNASFIPTDDYDLDNDGDLTENIDIDTEGSLRIFGGQVDAGAYEAQSILATPSIQEDIRFASAKFKGSYFYVAKLTVNLAGSYSNVSYSWTADGEPKGNLSYISNPCKDVVYEVTITDLYTGCAVTLSHVVTDPDNTCLSEIIDTPWRRNGVSETSELLNFDVFPNPSEGIFNINLNNSQKATLRVFDMNGQQVVEQAISEGQATIDLTTHAKGIYIIRIIDQLGQISTKKLTIH